MKRVQFPLDVKRGNATVRIYEAATKGYPEYRIAYREGGLRKFKTFSDSTKAQTEAASIAERLDRGEVAAVHLPQATIDAFTHASGLLKPSGIPLSVAVGHFAEAVHIMGGDHVVEAAKLYARRNGRNRPVKRPGEVACELVADAQARKLSTRYIEDLRSRCGRFGAAFEMPIDAITSADIRQFLDSLGLSSRSHNNFLRAIRTLFEFAKDRDYLGREHDEVSRVKLQKDRGGEIAIFQPEQLHRLLTAAPPQFLPALAIQAFAGLRSAETERLDWNEVNLKDGFIEIRAGKAKTATRRLVPVPANLKAWLKPVAQNEGKVWPHGHAFFYEQQAATAARAGVAWKHNALRHSFISYRVAEIQDVARVALEAGTSPQMIFRNYRELVRPADAKKWFSILPKRKSLRVSRTMTKVQPVASAVTAN